MNKLTQLEKRIRVLEKIVIGTDVAIKPVHPIIKKALEAISQVANQPISDIISRSRKRALVEARCIVAAYLRENTRMSLTDIGTIFGGRDHSSTLHALATHSNLMFLDSAYKKTNSDFLELMK